MGENNFFKGQGSQSLNLHSDRCVLTSIPYTHDDGASIKEYSPPLCIVYGVNVLNKAMLFSLC